MPGERPIVGIGLSALVMAACASGPPRAPWSAGAAAPGHGEVEELAKGQRVVARRVRRATRANLDWAAWHANPILAEPRPEALPAARLVTRPFGDAVVHQSLTAALAETGLTEAELARPLAFSPLVDWLGRENPRLAEGLDEARSAIRSESWGNAPNPQVVLQEPVALYLHREGDETAAWVRIELAPWATIFRNLPDADGDGRPELFARLPPDALPAAAVSLIEGSYAGKVLDEAEVRGWANELASYWYPSYNTDLYGPGGEAFPSDEVEAPVQAQMGAVRVTSPAVVLRGKPQGEALYLVLAVDGVGAAPKASRAPEVAATVARGAVTPKLEGLREALAAELAAHGGAWAAWAREVEPAHSALRKSLAARPKAVKAVEGADGWLFYRASLDYAVGGELTAQAAGKNPFPILTAFREMLAAKGIDLLFVPVPTKGELYPDRLLGEERAPAILNPWGRKLLWDLAGAGVETVDLLPHFLAARAQDAASDEPLYQPQDTHWTDRGLRLAAQVIAERLRTYPWFAELPGAPVSFGERPASFRRQGDLVSRLAPEEQARHAPVELRARQIVHPDGTLYDDDPESPILVIGDSFTGVYQRMDCRHAGVTAHLARALGRPVDLVMSYGGGPNVRAKLARRGPQALSGKRVVIWLFAARDLYGYWEAWAPVEDPALQ